MAQSLQRTALCTLCESPVEYHCNTCGCVLCSKCRDNHLESIEGRNHDVVPSSHLNKSSVQCADHADSYCEIWCKTCNKAVCGDCTTIPNHEGHEFTEVDVKREDKRLQIQKLFDGYSSQLSDWQNSLKETFSSMEKYEKDMNELDRKLVDRADEICKQVRAVERESRKQLKELKDASLRDLENQQKILVGGIQRLEKKIKQLQDILVSNDITAVPLCGEKNTEDVKPSVDKPPPVPGFTPGYVSKQDLKDMFGVVSDIKVKSVLLAEPSEELVINVEKSQCNPTIACVSSDHAWIQTAFGELQLLDRHGKTKRTVNIGFHIYAMTVTPQGNILLPDSNKRIKSMTMEGDITTLCNTELHPRGLCCLPNGDIVVTFRDKSRVVQCNNNGRILKEMDASLFQYPWYVTHSQLNRQLYVCDKSDPYNAFASGRVLAFDMNGKLQFQYSGRSAASFTPLAVSADLGGNVLIADIYNDRVHIVDKGGNFLQYLLTRKQGLENPLSVDVDNDGYAWIGDKDQGKIKVVKYMDRQKILT